MFSGLRTEVIGLRKEDYDTTSGLNGFSSNIKLLFYLKKKKKTIAERQIFKRVVRIEVAVVEISLLLVPSVEKPRSYITHPPIMLINSIFFRGSIIRR